MKMAVAAFRILPGMLLLVIGVLPLLATDAAHTYRVSPKLAGPARLKRTDDPILQPLNDALSEIATVYMQALFSGTHTAALESRMRALEIKLFDLLDALYKQDRMAEYMKYEAEVTRQMIIYNMLKKLFGYAAEENEQMNK